MKKFMISVLLVASCALPISAQEAGQKTFPTPEAAAKAMIDAVTNKDSKALLALVGNSAKDVLTNGDAKEDAADRLEFLKASKAKLQLLPLDESHTMMVVGAQNFPFPVPLVKKNKVWYFDGALGLDEIRARRIGGNELSVIRACEAYVDAQREYAKMDPEGSGIAHYAERFASTGDKHDGLYWEAGPGKVASPLGPFMAEAGRTSGQVGEPFHGYRYRILTSQGASAPGGAFSYLINGNMVAGFALVAYPATYGETGIMTFVVGPSGVVYQKDLKEQTAQLGSSMKSFDPDATWKKI